MKHRKISWSTRIACLCALATGLTLLYPLSGRDLSCWECIALFAIILMCMFAGGIALAYEETDEEETHHRSVYVKPDDLIIDSHGQKCIRIWARREIFLPFVPIKIVFQNVPAPEAYDAVRMAGKTLELKTEYVLKPKLFIVTDHYTKISNPSDHYDTSQKS